ncbi:YjcZ family sporulation protein [Ammoniphilus resinae]
MRRQFTTILVLYILLVIVGRAGN